MRKETIERILSGEKNEVNIKGHLYRVQLNKNMIILSPQDGRGDDASSELSYDSYEYTHGGLLFRLAVEAAKGIREVMIDQRAKDSDI